MIQNYKGTRHFDQREYLLLEKLKKSWRQTFKKFGFLEYKNSILDAYEIYEVKTSEEILASQLYTFTDKGKRRVVIRPEMTPGIANKISRLKNQNKLSDEVKLFTIGEVFRYENLQKGRTREHIQFNADVFAVKHEIATVEIIQATMETLYSLGFKKKDFVIKMNDRQHMEFLLTNNLNLNIEDTKNVFSLFDKKERLSDGEFEKELKQYTNVSIEKMEAALSKAPETFKYIEGLLKDVCNLEYSYSTTRGFDYYTGVVFEIFALSRETTRSIAGGGRYDKLVGKYGSSEVEAVGIGMGDVTLIDFIKEKNLDKSINYEKSVIIVSLDNTFIDKAYEIANKLRKKSLININLTTKYPKKLDKFYERMRDKNVSHIVEVSESLKLKDLETKKNDICSLEEIMQRIKQKEKDGNIANKRQKEL